MSDNTTRQKTGSRLDGFIQRLNNLRSTPMFIKSVEMPYLLMAATAAEEDLDAMRQDAGDTRRKVFDLAQATEKDLKQIMERLSSLEQLNEPVVHNTVTVQGFQHLYEDRHGEKIDDLKAKNVIAAVLDIAAKKGRV